MYQSFETMQAISQQRRQRYEAQATTARLLRDARNQGDPEPFRPRHRTFPWNLGLRRRPAPAI